MINVVCAVIADEQGRLLVCKRPEGKALAGKWEFPGGKVESGEVLAAALRREIAEELSCDIEVGDALPEVVHSYETFSIRLHPFRCRITSGKPVAMEHAEILWVDQSACASLDWAEADIPIWKYLG